MRASRTFRQGAIALVFLLLAACGGSNDDAPAAPLAPTATASYASSVPATAVVALDGSASTTPSTGTLTYAWALTGVPTGSAATIGNATAAQASLATDLVGSYTGTLTVNDGLKSQTTAFALAALTPPPTIVSNLVEPVSGVVQFTLSTDPGTATVNWTVDGGSIGSGAVVYWNTAIVADGSHVVVAQIQSPARYTVTVTRTLQVAQSPVSFPSATITESGGLFIATVTARSVNGITSVAFTLDGSAVLSTLGMPNACTDPTGAACASTGLDAYQFRGITGSGAHVVVATATDRIVRSLGTQLSVNVTDVP